MRSIVMILDVRDGVFRVPCTAVWDVRAQFATKPEAPVVDAALERALVASRAESAPPRQRSVKTTSMYRGRWPPLSRCSRRPGYTYSPVSLLQQRWLIIAPRLRPNMGRVDGVGAAAMCYLCCQNGRVCFVVLGVEALLATVQEVNMSPELCQRAAVAFF